MSLEQLIDSMLEFVARWGGTTLPRVIAAFMGLLLCVYIVAAVWERRWRLLPALAVFLLGLLLILVGLNPDILDWLGSTNYLTRIRMLMGVLSAVVLVVTFESIRRSHLQERYAILWLTTGLIILFCAFFPSVLDFFRSMLGFQYVTAVVAVVFTFLILVAFHFSIAMSGFQEDQSKIAQRCAILEARVEQLTEQLGKLSKKVGSAAPIINGKNIPVPLQIQMSDELLPAPPPRLVRGSLVSAILLIAFAVIAVLLVGMMVPQAIVGDEVTHYYLLTSQAHSLPVPVFRAEIPMEWGIKPVKLYPHTVLWHYLGAILYRFLGQSFVIVQTYQTLFWAQLLIVAFLLARTLSPKEYKSALLYLIVLASLPMCLIFSVTFYQDVPLAAQVLTAFYLLRKRRWIWATFFLVIALGIKEPALFFIPPFVFLLWRWEYQALKSNGSGSRMNQILRAAMPALISAVIFFGAFKAYERVVRVYSHSIYYPTYQFRRLTHGVSSTLRKKFMPPKPQAIQERSGKGSGMEQGGPIVTPYEVEIIANHPGDLRMPANYLIYGGVVLWMVLFLGVLGWASRNRIKTTIPIQTDGQAWLFGVGIWYLALTAYFLRSAPDARFFLPGVPFIVLPMAQWAVRLPGKRYWLNIIAALAIFQSSQVLAKTYNLRRVSPEINEVIRYLRQNPPSPRKLFMYPEGNYRLFPAPHNWYLDYQLRSFWRAKNDMRLQMLHDFSIGAIVIKKHLIAPVDSKINNLGVYPDFFVEDLKNDSRFQKVFENKGVIVYLVPPAEPTGTDTQEISNKID